ncbi:retrovirus-related pol polyprotein from transposon TNT 1-94 [Tanacetum coccineum]
MKSFKFQQESFGNNPSTPARGTRDFDSVFVIGKMKASLQGKDNVINKLKTQISYLQETRSEADCTLDFGTVRFGNDHFGAIIGYGDYVIGDSVISRLWHRRLNHLNFGTINDLARKVLVRGLPRLKFGKDHLCSACQLGKSKKHTHKPKPDNTNLEVLNILHMDLCSPMRVQTINGKKYILVIVDGYSRFTWVKFLRSKDETPAVVIKFLKQIQVGLNKTVRYVRTDNGTEFVNKDLTDYYERVGIFHQKTVPRMPQQNGVVERRNRTL